LKSYVLDQIKSGFKYFINNSQFAKVINNLKKVKCHIWHRSNKYQVSFELPKKIMTTTGVSMFEKTDDGTTGYDVIIDG